VAEAASVDLDTKMTCSRPAVLRAARVLIALGLGGCWMTAARAEANSKVTVMWNGSQPGHYLAWRGRPLLLIGDSVTQGWMECGTNFQQEAYVDALAARGLNLLMLWAYKGTCAQRQRQDPRIGYDAPELWPWEGSPETRTFDLHRFNASYFNRLRRLVRRAEEKGVIVLITVHDGWTKTCFDSHPFNRALGNGPLSARQQYVELGDAGHAIAAPFDAAWGRPRRNQYFQERFCAKLIEELAPFSNVIYEMFNEGEWYDRALRRKHEQHFLAFFRARCANLLLSNSDHVAGNEPHADPNLDVVTLHPKGWIGQSRFFIDGFQHRPHKPYLYSEPVPEFDGTQPPLNHVRQSLWETALAGAGWVNQNDPSFGWDSHAAITHRAADRDRAYDLAGHAARFFNQSGVRFWDMAPAGKLASSGICLSRPGEEYVAYSTSDGPITLDLSALEPGPVEVRWLNPRSGHSVAGETQFVHAANTAFTPPFAGDAVLHVRRMHP
jgi:hypothetical protein